MRTYSEFRGFIRFYINDVILRKVLREKPKDCYKVPEEITSKVEYIVDFIDQSVEEGYNYLLDKEPDFEDLEEQERQKRKIKSIIGGTVGLALGYGFYALFNNQYPEKINFGFNK